jgi:hypothetical protein
MYIYLITITIVAILIILCGYQYVKHNNMVAFATLVVPSIMQRIRGVKDCFVLLTLLR